MDNKTDSKDNRIGAKFLHAIRGGVDAVQHLSNLLGLRKKRLVVKVLAPISAAEIAEKNWTRKEVCQQSEAMIRRTLEDDTIW